MHDLKLVLKFKLAGDKQFQIRGVSRIVVDGCGGLSFHDVQNDRTERLEMGKLASFSLLPASSAFDAAGAQLAH